MAEVVRDPDVRFERQARSHDRDDRGDRRPGDRAGHRLDASSTGRALRADDPGSRRSHRLVQPPDGERAVRGPVDRRSDCGVVRAAVVAASGAAADGRAGRRRLARRHADDARRRRPTPVPVRVVDGRRRRVPARRRRPIQHRPPFRRRRGVARRPGDPGPGLSVPTDRTGRGDRHARHLAVHHAERRLLPGRHRVHRSARRHGHVAPHDPRHGRSRDGADVRATDVPGCHRTRHHARVRLERGRRPLHRERPMDRRPAEAAARGGRRPSRRRPDRLALRRRVHGRHADVGRDGRARRDARGLDERRDRCRSPTASPSG